MKTRIAIVLVATAAALGAAACSSSKKASCQTGSEGCDCTPGGGCDPGLVCVGGVCVPDGTDAGTDVAGDADVAGDDGGTMDPPADDGSSADTWADDGSSADTVTDDGGPVTVPPSCEGMDPGACGGQSCCRIAAVDGGWFAMGRGDGATCPGGSPSPGGACTSASATCLDSGTTWGCVADAWEDLGGDDGAVVPGGDDETPEHVARVDDFGLDAFEVTVGRMRRFVEAYDRAALLSLLDAGAGAHPLVPGSGWDGEWDGYLPEDRDALESALACHDAQTWTDVAGDHETHPINCVSWYLAYAFCAWDGGRLPTEAEWEYAAAGGSSNLLYPWGDAEPTASHANFLATDNSPLVDVFAKPAGAGAWSHEGLAGSVWEWVLDLHDPGWYAGAGADCSNCANVSGDGARTMKGGDWQYHAADLRPANRFPGSAGSPWLGSGLRCAH